MNLLFLGDIVGQTGRSAVARWLPGLVEEFQIDFVIANAENAAGGLGCTPQIIRDLTAVGVHAFTLGNHTWRKKELIPAIDRLENVVRPANYPRMVPGQGARLFHLPDGRKVGLVSVLGRVYMEAFDCPFETARREVEELREQTRVVLVDMHAEATSEKVALGWYLDGKCSAVVGTHTHVQTADDRVLPYGTAYITDVGMCGPFDSVIGTERDKAIKKFLTGLPSEFTVASERPGVCAVAIEINDATGGATAIHRIQRVTG